ncbi:Alpha/Beta hydrolase protein [Thermothelomyces heterothallicus CBS 202.75]|uniref:Alpha/Beta hydrolase protein n=1 Tax=Thermothelomyces heterothallicus CBS 202.75 TaxID=1149848 RepID=UPI0037441802
MTAEASSDEAGKLSPWDRIVLVGLFPLFAARWLITFALNKSPGLHWRQRLALTFLQAQRAAFPIRHLRWLTRRVSTGEAVVRYCSKNKIPHKSVVIDSPAAASSIEGVPAATFHLLTVPTVEENAPGRTFLYFHGGGFVNPLRDVAHMPFIMQCAEACHARQAVILEYALAPEHPYPAQLVQCVATLQYLLGEMKLRPEDVVLAGDSAGGQLVGALLAHLAQPSPYAAAIKVDGQFRAALFVSPFVRMPPDEGSYEANHGKDYLNRPQVDRFMSAWKGSKDEVWANLCGVEQGADIWKLVFARGRGRGRGDRGLVPKAMVTVGTSEVFLECCRSFAKEHVGAETVFVGRETDCRVLGGMDRVLAECEAEVHVQAALDCAVGYNEGAMQRAIASWLAGL